MSKLVCFIKHKGVRTLVVSIFTFFKFPSAKRKLEDDFLEEEGQDNLSYGGGLH